MPFSLGIKIDGACIPDTEVKIIVLLIYGFNYNEIAECLAIEYNSVKTKICTMRGYLEVEDNTSLLRKAHAYGFDFYGNVYGKDVLHHLDRKRIARYVPRIANEKKLPALVYAP